MDDGAAGAVSAIVNAADGQAVAVDTLLALPIFEGIDPGWLKRRDDPVIFRRFKKDEIVCREGELASTAFYLLSGSVEIWIEAAKRPVERGPFDWLRRLAAPILGRPADPPDETHPMDVIPIDDPIDLRVDDPVARLGPDHLFGEMSCLDFHPRPATVRAAEDCELLELPRSYVIQLKRHSKVLAKMMEDSYADRALKNHLRRMRAFRSVKDDFVYALRPRVRLMRFGPGDAIVREGEPADAIYVVRLGFVRVARERAGQEEVLRYLHRDDYLGLDEFLTGWPHEATCTAVAPPHQQSVVQIKLLPNGGRLQFFAVARRPDFDELGIDPGALGECTRKGLADEIVETILKAELRGAGADPDSIEPSERGRRRKKIGERFKIAKWIEEKVKFLPEDLFEDEGFNVVEVVRIGFDVLAEVVERFPKVRESLEEERRRRLDRRAAPAWDPSVRKFLDQGLLKANNVLLIDLDRCTRCDDCVRACADSHDGLTRLLRDGERFDRYLVATACRSCLDPLCMLACPVSAVRRRHTREIVIESWCIGCGPCAQFCPYECISVSEPTPPDKKGKAVTCDLCAGLTGGPRCVSACPHDAAMRVDPKRAFRFTPTGEPVLVERPANP